MRLLLLVLPLILVSAVAAAQGTVEKNVRTVTYVVEGTSIDEVAASLHRRGPELNGQRFFGLTEWTIGAEYRFVQENGRCRIDRPHVRAEITVTLPEWTGRNRARAEDRDRWNRFIESLTEHEDGHRLLAEEAAEVVLAELQTVTGSDCTRTNEIAAQRVRQVLTDYNRRNEVYDEMTRHGLDQGAAWPPPRQVAAGN